MSISMLSVLIRVFRVVRGPIIHVFRVVRGPISGRAPACAATRARRSTPARDAARESRWLKTSYSASSIRLRMPR